jgi:hypothetical protein
MAPRLVGVESTDPWLPDVVKSKAVQARIDDLAGNFTAGDVEGALAELIDTIDELVITGGGMAAASAAETVAGTITDKAVTPAGLAVALPFRFIAPSGADDTAAIQAAATAVTPGGTLWMHPGVYNTSATLTFNGINVIMSLGAATSYIQYSGTGNAVLITNGHGCRLELSVRRPTRLWDTTDATSEGVVILNSNEVRGRLDVRNFWRGVTLRGDNNGTSYCNLDLAWIQDCKTGLKFDAVGTGWANENRFTGKISYTSGAASYVGTCMIDLSTAGNGNEFRMTLEGSVHERTFKCATTYNLWIGCRWEANPNGALEFLAAAQFNYVIGGYGLVGSNMITDAGSWNTIIGAAYVSHTFGQGSNPRGMLLKTQTAIAPLLTVAEANGAETRMDIQSDGTATWYISTGKEANNTPLLQLLGGIGTAGGIKFGHTSTAAVGHLYCYNTSYLGLTGNLLWTTDNTHDVGVATNRPRDVFVGRNLRIGGALDHDGTTVGFYNATPVVKAANPGTAAGTDAAVINAIVTALRNLGLVT